MAETAPIYDLTLMLATEAGDDQRAKIVADVEAAITKAGGSIERNDDWGRRPMAYQIRHQPEAEYRLLQFKAPPALIDELSHTLRITDGVLRHRVIKVRPGTPEAPSSPPPVVAAAPAAAAAPPSREPAPPSREPAPSSEEPAPSSREPAPES